MIFNPSAASDIEQRSPVFAAPPASPASPPVLLSTHVAEEPIPLDLNDGAASPSSSSDDEAGPEDPNAMTIAEMINTIIEDGIVLPTEEEIAGRRAAAGLPAEIEEEPTEEMLEMMKEMVDLTYTEEEKAQLLEDMEEELAARNEAEDEAIAEAEAAEAEAAKTKAKGKGKGKEKAVAVEEEKEAEAGPSTNAPAAATVAEEEEEEEAAAEAGPSTAPPAAAPIDDTWKGLSRLLGGDLLSDRDITTILLREVSPPPLPPSPSQKNTLTLNPPTQSLNTDSTPSHRKPPPTKPASPSI